MFITSTFNHVGRLGNQLFQIATNVGFARQFGHETGITPWDYQHAFQLETVQILEPNPHPRTSFLLYERGAKDWFRGLLEEYDFLKHSNNDILIDLRGNFQSFQTFRHAGEEIRDRILAFRPEFVASVRDKRLILPNSCAIHIRRTDYLDFQHIFYMLPLIYYQKAIQTILSETPCRQFTIFSDDIPWCREFIEPLLPGMAVAYSEGLSDIEDLCAMASCDYHILANSSYSWWASYIGHSRLAIAPPIWVYYKEIQPERIINGLFEGRPNTRVLMAEHDAILHGAYLAWMAEQMQPTRVKA